MFRYILVVLMSLAAFGCSAADNGDGDLPCSDQSLNKLYSNYMIFDVVKYGGGLTTEASAKKRIDEKVIVEKEGFQVRDFVVTQPSYKLTCYSLPSEGEVDAHRRSNFYGFGLNRASVEVINIYDKGDAIDEPSISFEVLDGELWEMFDGWLYKMKPSN